MWRNNTPWHNGRLPAVLDGDRAAVGPAGIDLGWLRRDAAWCHGAEAAEYVPSGWEAEAGAWCFAVAKVMSAWRSAWPAPS